MRTLSEFVEHIASLGVVPRTVIDVGVCYGTPELQSGIPDAYHILIEPVPSLKPRLEALCRKYGGEYHLLAAGETRGELPLAIPHSHPEAATLLAAHGHDTVIVPVETLDNLFLHRGDLERPILLKTDCQGYDLSVMKGAKALLASIDVVVMEANMFHPCGDYANADFGDIVLFMREHGFAVYDILSYHPRPFDRALGYVDVAFAPENGPLRAQHRWA